MPEEGLIKGKDVQSVVFSNLKYLVTLADKPAPPCICIVAINPTGDRGPVLITYPDWPAIQDAVQSLAEELEIF